MRSVRRVAVTCVVLGFLASVTHGAQYYVSPQGEDSQSGSATAPFRTIRRALEKVRPGDTVFLEGGTYEEEIDFFPGGDSWERPVRLAALPGQRVTLRPPRGANRVITLAGARSAYIIIEGLILDAVNVTYDAVKITRSTGAGYAHHIRLLNCEVKNAPNQGILVTWGSDGNEFLGLDIHHNGVDTRTHGIYLKSSGNLIEGCSVWANAGYGVHIYNTDESANDNVIRNCRIYDNQVRAGILLGSGRNNAAYNNLIWGNQGGIRVGYGAVNNRIFHNVIYKNRDWGVDVYSGNTVLVKNNIIYRNGEELSGDLAGVSLSSNLVGQDPKFVDPERFDFRLREDSSGVDAGTSLPEVQTDYEGKPRPQGGAQDIGAFETRRPLAAPRGLRAQVRP